MTSQVVTNELLIDGLDDWVYLAQLKGILLHVAGITNEQVIMEEALATLDVVLRAGFVEIGDVIKNVGFVPWNMSIEAALDRVRREWQQLNGGPSLGDICWLQNTPKGNCEAEKVLKAERGNTSSESTSAGKG
ncbi:MAG: hypothetical protein H0X37_25520 [Herpetosiphonaceae bacterium]|nr:hypothetical protein [Herpetosiphonaceae bacterium]